ncbi:MAG: DUF952 domain-containing protein [Actinomycetia bacterium]|nr:DUF952 domain-containing protein [Actinomycetes bacterium]
MTLLHHLTTRPEWDTARITGRYAPGSLDTERFVHLSTGMQVALTAQRFYRDVPNLVVLDIDPHRCAAEIRWEDPVPGDPGAGELFPHLYGPLEVTAVMGVRDVKFVGDQVKFSL